MAEGFCMSRTVTSSWFCILQPFGDISMRVSVCGPLKEGFHCTVTLAAFGLLMSTPPEASDQV